MRTSQLPNQSHFRSYWVGLKGCCYWSSCFSRSDGFEGASTRGLVSGYGYVSTIALDGYGTVTTGALSGYGTATTGSLVGASGLIGTGAYIGYATGYGLGGYGKRDADANAYYGYGATGHV